MRFFVLSVLLSIFSTAAMGAVNIVDVRLDGNNSITLELDKQINADQYQVDFFRDIVQVTLTKASVYPAKMQTIEDNPELKKIFVYQYTPNVVRARVTVNGKGEDFKKLFHVTQDGRKLHLAFSPKVAKAPVDEIKTSMAATKKVEVPKLTAAEKLLLKEATEPTKKLTGPPKKADSENKLTEGQDGPGIGRLLIVFAFILFLLGALMVILKAYKKTPRNNKEKKNRKKSGPSIGFLKKAIGRTISNDGIIEVLASHYIAPKQSIVVARVKDQILVLGVTNDNMSLITQIDGDEQAGLDRIDEIVEKNIGPELGASPIRFGNRGSAKSASSRPDSFRDHIKQKVGQMKPL